MSDMESEGNAGSGEARVVPPDLSHVPEGSHRRGRRRMSDAHIARLRRRRRRRRILLVILAVLVALAAWGAYLAYSALVAKREIQAAVASASSLGAGAVTGDANAAKTALDQMGGHIDKAYAQTGNPLWKPVEFIPYYGSDVKTVRESVRIMADMSDNALPQLETALTGMQVKDFGVSGGKVSLPGLKDNAESLRLANETITQANTEFQRLGGTHVPQLTRMLADAQRRFDSAASLMDAASRFAQVAPAMLDVDGSGAHSYLIIGENNAEARAGGGLPASWGVMTVDDGVITISDFISDTAIAQQTEPVVPLTAEEQSLFGDKLATIAHDVNITPDFTRTGRIARAMWQKTQGQTVDGVIAVDPVFLQQLIGVTGPVTLADGTTLDGTNAARTLLHDEYYRTDDYAAQDAFFADAAGATFRHAMASNALDARQLLTTFSTSVSNGHVKLWLADEGLQRQLENTAIGGTLSRAAGKPTVGVYVNNASQSKMDWYLDRSVTTTYVGTRADGGRDYDVHISMTNTFDAADAASTPQYVLGDGIDGLTGGRNATLLYVTAPADGRLVSWRFSDGSQFDNYLTLDGLTVGVKRVELAPGQSLEATVRVRTSNLATGNPRNGLVVRQTPLIRNE
ncbi:DUF4012 domain-containing protein [Bifidobacterium stellenboschense]|uniref:DUF4012 domain-containing protein n=1 Tax=Bifidobacterium stellenboschense TaxID=762211 RepID=A0A087DKT9_9BIFI|nr:DUF4012 domain-containing protein [Bifidobacterium stellenboschense]KFI96139.1 hypothetical protein BSTEL_1172 [Bifidobacterium stellenboschense]